ncbi:MAG: arylamine N-acetyltransferase family protein [Eubacteriales bacterium]
MDKFKIQKYFNRIGLNLDPDNLTLDYNLLRLLQFAHVTNVPYENLDIIHGIPLLLEPIALFDKIVERRRGGYCFELNGLFGWLLSELGFKTKDCMARYLRGETDIPMRRHRVIIAETPDGRILCDVGVGDRAARYALKLEEGLVQEQLDEIYRFEREPFFGWVLYDYYKGEWKRMFAFTEEEQLNIDYIMPSYYCENHPASIFKAGNMMSLKTSTGRKTISGMQYRVFDSDTVTVTEIKDDDMLNLILSEHFGINN